VNSPRFPSTSSTATPGSFRSASATRAACCLVPPHVGHSRIVIFFMVTLFLAWGTGSHAIDFLSLALRSSSICVDAGCGAKRKVKSFHRIDRARGTGHWAWRDSVLLIRPCSPSPEATG
jgi:hypothetical protein